MTKSTNARRSTPAARVSEEPTVLLKTVYAAHMKDNPNSTLTTKKMRARLRVEARSNPDLVHVHNATWLFRPSAVDQVRALFDPAFAEKLARRVKRSAKPTKAKREQVEQEEQVEA